MTSSQPINPFILNARITIRVKDKMPPDGPPSPRFYEKDRNTRFYHAEMMKYFPSLSSAGANLLMWISCNLQWGKDVIKLDRQAFMDWTKSKSLQTFYNAKKELLDASFIAQYQGSEYWINPMRIFCGDRLKYAWDNEIVEVYVPAKPRKITGGDTIK